MIEASHTTVIDRSTLQVWDYVQDIRRWASLFPGCRDCEVLDENRSRWVVKVGAGGLVKTINVLVTVTEWRGPERVNFTYQLESEPVTGSGSYSARPADTDSTEVHFQVTVEGSGQAAPMWEAVSKPLLPQMAKTFATKLKAAIEAESAPTPVTAPQLSWWQRLCQWLSNLWRSPRKQN